MSDGRVDLTVFFLALQRFGALGGQLGSSDPADRSSAEKAIQNVESNVPSGGAHRDEAAVDLLP
jgi:hypothetical protein